MDAKIEQTDSTSRITMSVTAQEVLILAGSIREALEQVEDWEFQTRMGVDKPTVRRLQHELGAVLDKLPSW